MKNYISDGDAVTITATAAVASGKGVLVGDLFGVATTDIASGAQGEIKTRGGAELDKVPAEAWAQGVKIYWDNSAKLCTSVVGSNKLIGCALAAAAAGAAVGSVRLNGTV
ncbi:DUF2190 family protein [Rubellimicrobium aerolatum]|uniref:DUF2190 family protein n=1 Tax=Rubellimicrobium aerolatum TaxID=490979 RepID=A0ABW0SER1_9RHOB|nr:DUF2190 family protein [Rubellimicrobium aerolatum]MBP1806466.1 putative RecA/RadA family phage recombinase [Rubellimicrobium aerolatum]